MSRIQSLVSRPKRTLAALATVLIAVGITAASGASFSASSANANNVFTAGTMTMSNTPNMATLSASNIKPGDAATSGTVMIKNTGSLAGAFSLAKANLVDVNVPNPASLLSTQLNLVVTDCGAAVTAVVTDPVCGEAVANDDVVKYTGTIAAMNPTALGNIPGGTRHLYKFSVDLPLATTNAFQGASTTVDFAWNAS
jgi:Camelysin metallo-endopeptidase